MRRYIFCYSMILFSLGVVTGKAQPPAVPTTTRIVDNKSGLTSSDVIAGIRSRYLRYSDRRYQFTQLVFNRSKPDDVFDQRKIELWRSGDKIYVEEIPTDANPNHLGNMRTAWNGAIQTGYTEFPSAPPRNRFSGSITGTRGHVAYGQWTAFALEHLMLAHMSLADAVKKGDWNILGSKSIGGKLAVGIGTTQRLQAFNEHAEIWVLPECDFVTVGIEESSIPEPDSNKPILRPRLENVSVAQFGDRWLMSQADRVTANGNAEEQIYRFHLLSYSPGIPTGYDFIVKFPVGTSVFDSTRKMGFNAGKFVEVTDANKLVRFITIDKFPEYKQLTDYSIGLTNAEYQQAWGKRQIESGVDTNFYNTSHTPRNENRRLWFWVANIVVGLIIFGLLFYGRKWQRSKTSSR